MAADHTHESYRSRLLLLVGGVLLFRLIYAAFFATNPAGDEAYYWDWGRHLDYGYYSKPPFIAWLYAFVDWIGNGTLFGIRASSAVIAALSALVLFGFVRDVYDARTAWIAVILTTAVPANSVLAFFLTIDAPLILCWTVALWMLWKAVSGKATTSTYVFLFLALAIGHLSKQMMMLFPVLALIFIVSHVETRHLLKRAPLWIAMLASYISLAPPLIWNANNDWITFKHTSHHFESHPGDGNIIVERVGEFLAFIGTQLGVLSPIIAVVLYATILPAVFKLRKVQTSTRYLAVFGGIPLVLMLFMAMRQTLQPNWPAVFYVPGLVLATGWFAQRIPSRLSPEKSKSLLRSGLFIGWGLVAFFYLSPLVFKAIGKEGHTADPNRRLVGYDILADKFHSLRTSLPEDEKDFIIALGHRDITSQLAFGLPDQPIVYHWQRVPGIHSQYQLWNTPLDDGFSGKDGWIVIPNGGKIPKPLRKSFDRVELIEEVEIPMGYDRTKLFAFWRGIGLHSWPEDPEE